MGSGAANAMTSEPGREIKGMAGPPVGPRRDLLAGQPDITWEPRAPAAPSKQTMTSAT